jgi:hypothetical protein
MEVGGREGQCDIVEGKVEGRAVTSDLTQEICARVGKRANGSLRIKGGKGKRKSGAAAARCERRRHSRLKLSPVSP